MLTPQQRYSIASTLSTSSLEAYVERIKKSPLFEAKLSRPIGEEIIEFATKIDKFFKKRDGFIPKNVLELCK